jgi:hypothetical protein
MLDPLVALLWINRGERGFNWRRIRLPEVRVLILGFRSRWVIVSQGGEQDVREAQATGDPGVRARGNESPTQTIEILLSAFCFVPYANAEILISHSSIGHIQVSGAS